MSERAPEFTPVKSSIDTKNQILPIGLALAGMTIQDIFQPIPVEVFDGEEVHGERKRAYGEVGDVEILISQTHFWSKSESTRKMHIFSVRIDLPPNEDQRSHMVKYTWGVDNPSYQRFEEHIVPTSHTATCSRVDRYERKFDEEDMQSINIIARSLKAQLSGIS